MTAPRKHSYAWLSGKWHQYHLTCDRQVHDGVPFWLHHDEEFTISERSRLSGVSTSTDHPAGTRLTYVISGSILRDKMALRYDCNEVSTEFVLMLYPNLLKQTVIVGSWMGWDYDLNPSVGPIILSRAELGKAELDRLVREIRVISRRSAAEEGFNPWPQERDSLSAD